MSNVKLTKIKDILKPGEALNSIFKSYAAYTDELELGWVKGAKISISLQIKLPLDILHKKFPLMAITNIASGAMDSKKLLMIQLTPEIRITGLLCMFTPGVISESFSKKFLGSTLNINLADVTLTSFSCMYAPTMSVSDMASTEEILLDLAPPEPILDVDETYTIGIISKTAQGFSVINKSVEYKSKHEDLDLLYQDIDDNFMNVLLKTINESTKGVIIFNGEPGTGKTWLIRKIVRDYGLMYDKEKEEEKNVYIDEFVDVPMFLKSVPNKKLFIYVPASLGNVFGDPEFTSLLQTASSNNNKGIVIIVEDSEQLLDDRGISNSTSISTILNMSDGILNDMLNVQFIFTYNTSTDAIDPALLRSGRLLAKKEIRKLSAEKATRLSKHLKLDKVYDADTSIADVFKFSDDVINKVLIDDDVAKNIISLRR